MIMVTDEFARRVAEASSPNFIPVTPIIPFLDEDGDLAVTLCRPNDLDSAEMHELDIQNMADEHVNTRLATTDLPHREGK